MNKEYLRNLYILKSYLIKNQWSFSSWLRSDIAKLVIAINLEIDRTKESIDNYVRKQENKQVSFFEEE